MGRKTPHLLSAALLLMVWIATPVLSLVHGLVQEHSYCAEHERVEDAHEAHSANSLVAHGEARTQRRETEQHSAGHEECAFGDSFTRETLVYDFGFSTTPAPFGLADANEHSAAEHTRSISLIRIAPKNSPPIAA